MKNVVGIDKDDITREDAKKLKETIQINENCNVLLWETKRGFHLELIYKKEIQKKDDFIIRERYGDCPERMRISRLRGEPYDLLFSIKDGHWRELIL